MSANYELCVAMCLCGCLIVVQSAYGERCSAIRKKTDVPQQDTTMFLDVQEALIVETTTSKDDTARGSKNPDRYVLFRHGQRLKR